MNTFGVPMRCSHPALPHSSSGEAHRFFRIPHLPRVFLLSPAYLYTALCLVLSSPIAQAATPQDGLYWLERVVSASREQNYSGVFVYRHAGRGETSRITHRVAEGREHERLEVLDGSPREIIRDNDEVKCYLPETRTLIVEKRGRRPNFPMVLPTSAAGLSEHYYIRKGPVERIAGRDAQLVLLEPRDTLRYGHKFWVDTQSGLLLKAGMINENNESVETFAFTQLQVGLNISPELLKSSFDQDMPHWNVVNLQAQPPGKRKEQWLFKVQLPGFRKIADMRRNFFKKHRISKDHDTSHIIFSDGIATISVFIEPRAQRPEIDETAMGMLNLYRRTLEDQTILLMGEVPRSTLKTFGDGIELRNK